MRTLRLIFSVALVPTSCVFAQVIPPPATPTPARIEAIAAMLDPLPQGVAPSFDDRAAWSPLAEKSEFRDKTIKRAEWFLKEPIPQVSDAEWEAAIRTKERKYDKMLDQRRLRLSTFMLAEGMENSGRFVPSALQEIDAICSEKSWVMPAHSEFTGSNDLGSAMTAWSLATAIGMLDDRMPQAQRNKVKENIIRRVVEPYLQQTRDPSLKRDWWRTDPNNWNSVVHAGIVGAALSVVDSPQDRAEVIAATELELPHYLEGFHKDGYSQEGMGYWKYGFGHYILLAEAVASATHGKIDLIKEPIARKIAEFPQRFEIEPGIYPAYGDCLLLEQSPDWLYDILHVRYGIGERKNRTLTLDGMFSNFLYAWGINLSFEEFQPNSQSPSSGKPLRDWFPESQVLVSRPSPDGPRIGVSFCGGNNGVSHGHHDLGQFLVTVNGKLVLADPGATVYNSQTFGPQRWENQILNSYGHSVPVIDGKLQGNGPSFASHVLSTSFSDEMDSITLDLKGAYEIFAINELTRKLTHDRKSGSVTITDTLKADKPLTFESSILTYGQVHEESPDVWIVAANGESVRVKIDAGGANFTVTPEALRDKSREGKVTRLGIKITAPSADLTLTTTITPGS